MGGGPNRPNKTTEGVYEKNHRKTAKRGVPPAPRRGGKNGTHHGPGISVSVGTVAGKIRITTNNGEQDNGQCEYQGGQYANTMVQTMD